jgi:hypothetical protein
MSRPASYPSPDPSKPTSLWPRDLLVGDQRIPLTILGAQADQLAALAGDALNVSVRSTADPATGLCAHRLIVSANGLENFYFELVRLTHPLHAVFPVGVRCETTALVVAYTAEGAPANAARLEEFLRELFGQSSVRNAVRSLFAQGQAAKSDKKKGRRASDESQPAA